MEPGQSINFSAAINFASSSDRMLNNSINSDLVNRIVGIMTENPSVSVMISGNMAVSQKLFNAHQAGQRTLNSQAWLNGVSSSVRNLMIARGRAFEDALIKRGIDWRRIRVRTGSVTPASQGGMSVGIKIRNGGF